MGTRTSAPSSRFFVAGVCCYWAWRRTAFRHDPRGWVLLVPAAILAYATVTNQEFSGALTATPFHLERTIWGITFGLAVLATCLAPSVILRRGPLPMVGRLSYSVYLLHPMVVFVGFEGIHLADGLASVGIRGADAFGVLSVLALVCVVALSAVTYRFIEAPGMALGRRVARRAAAGEPIAAPAFLTRFTRALRATTKRVPREVEEWP